VSFKLFGCLFSEDGDLLKHAAARKGDIYNSIICACVGTKR